MGMARRTRRLHLRIPWSAPRVLEWLRARRVAAWGCYLASLAAGLPVVSVLSGPVQASSSPETGASSGSEGKAALDSLDFEAFLRRLQEDHPFLEQHTLAARKARVKRERFLAAEDWKVSARSSYAYSQPVENSTFAPEELSQTSLEADVGRGFWETGGRLSVRWQTSYTDQAPPGIPFPDLDGGGPTGGASGEIVTGAPFFHRQRVMVRFDQPLLQNRGGALDRLAYDLGGKRAVIGSLRATERQERFLKEMGQLYLEWVALREREAITRERRQLARRQVDYVRRQRAANLVDEADLLRAEQAFLVVRGQVELLAVQTDALAQRLSLLADLPGLQHQTPRYDLYARHDSLPLYEDLLARIETQSRSLAIMGIRIQQAERSLGAQAERTRPQVDVRLGAGLIGGDREFGSSFEMDHPELSIALVFSHLLGARVATTRKEVFTLEIRRLRRQRQHLLNELLSSVRATRLQLRRLRGVMKTNQRGLSTARERAVQEQDLYQQGRQALLFVIDAQDEVQRARLTLTDNALRYHRQLLNLWELLDELLPAASEDGRMAERMLQ